MLGPVGTLGSAGAGPRPAGTRRHKRVMLSFSQSHGSPLAAFRRSVPLMSLDFPVDVSATHNSMPFSFVLLKETRFPSGEKLTPLILALGGTAIFFSVPSGIDFSVIAMIPPPRCWRPLVFGLIRTPATRWIGSASSAI